MTYSVTPKVEIVSYFGTCSAAMPTCKRSNHLLRTWPTYLCVGNLNHHQ
jgi:hypothetical protein